MAEETKKTFSQKLKQIFITGILASLPLVVTIYLVLFIYRLLTNDAIPVVAKIFARYNYELPLYALQLAAFILVILIVFCVGLFARAYIGKKIIALMEKLISNIPVARTIYHGIKQVVDSLKSTSGSTFSKVVMVEFPRREMWMIGFVVRDAQKLMTNNTVGDVEAYNVFVPTAPNPTSGFVAVVPKAEVRELDIPVEDGIKFIFSVGLLTLEPRKTAESLKQEVEKSVH